MATRSNARTDRTLAIVGAASIVLAIAMSLVTNDDAAWAWGAMILTTFLGLVLFAVAAALALKRRFRGARAAR